jgi:hypothetical protein
MPGEYTTATLTAHFEAMNRRLDYVERGLQDIARAAHSSYATWAESQSVPDEVVELARAGKKLEAIQRLRQLTGANVEQARTIVAGL